MTYDFCPGEGQVLGEEISGFRTVSSGELRDIFDQTNSTNKEMYILNEDAQANTDRLTYVSPGSSVSIKIYPEEITKSSDHTVKVIYAVTASPSADRATFITTNFYRVCPGEILTIGDEMNEESLEWARGPFYGCAS